MDETSVENLINQIDQMAQTFGPPALVIIDTYARNMGAGDENSNSDAGLVVKRLDAMREHLGCAVLIVHHTGHGDNGRPRGASALPAAMDSIFRLDGKVQDGVVSNLQLVQVKSKESELVNKIPLAIKSVELVGRKDAKGVTMSSAVLVSGQPDVSGLLDELPKSSKTALDAYRNAAKLHGTLDATGAFAGLNIEVWRDAFYAANPSATFDSRKKSFQRARSDIGDRGLIVENGNFAETTGLTKGLADDIREVLAESKEAVGTSSQECPQAV